MVLRAVISLADELDRADDTQTNNSILISNAVIAGSFTYLLLIAN